MTLPVELEAKSRFFGCGGKDPVRWNGLLRHLASVTFDYIDSLGDLPYGYGELAEVSLLSAACWRAGYAAICEASTYKSRAEDGRRRSDGRGDLYFGNHNTAVWAEAKLNSCHVGQDGETVFASSNRTLGLACADARRCAPDITAMDWKGSKAVGVLFCTITCHPDQVEKKDFAARLCVVENATVKIVAELGQEGCNYAVFGDLSDWALETDDRGKHDRYLGNAVLMRVMDA